MRDTTVDDGSTGDGWTRRCRKKGAVCLAPRRMLLTKTAKLANRRLLSHLLGRPAVAQMLTPSHQPLTRRPRLRGPINSPTIFLPRLGNHISVTCYYLNAAVGRTNSRRTFHTISLSVIITFTGHTQSVNTQRLVIVDTLKTSPGSSVFCGQIGNRVRRTLHTRS